MVYAMRKTLLRLGSLIMIIALAISSFACNKKDNVEETVTVSSEDKISADSPWFENKKINIDLGIDESKPAEYIDTKLVGSDEKYIVVVATVYYKLLGDNSSVTDSDMQEYEASTTPIISVYDRATEQTVNHINVKKDISLDGVLDVINYADGRITVNSLKYDASTNKTTCIETDLEPLSGNVLDTRKIDADEKSSIDRSYVVGNYKIEVIKDWNSGLTGFTLRVYSTDGNSKDIFVDSNGTQIYSVNAILPITDKTALICTDTDKGSLYYLLDLEQSAVTSTNYDDYKWLDIYVHGNLTSGTDGNVYYPSSLGIFRINVEKKTAEAVFDYSWCSINRHILNFFYVAECTGESFLLCGQVSQQGSFIKSVQSEFVIYEFKKADQNPHAGKTVLELYVANGELDYTTADAIIRFNETNSNCFIQVSDRYNLNNYFDYTIGFNSQDEADEYNLSVKTKMSNALAIDIINGKGPDILLNTSSFGLLNNNTYLADLTPYVGTLDSNKYYTNVIDGAKYDGALYQLPITFAIDGIHTNSKYAGNSGKGFTTVEYEGFLKGALNGKDVIGAGQAVYFAKLFSAESDLFIKNGKADFTSPEFKELARYVMNNVPQSSQSWGASLNDITIATQEGRCAVYNSCGYISTYLSDTEALSGGTAILGIPSSDGRGPLFSPSRSIAVSAQAKSIDACGEFVKMLLSDDVQLSYAMCDSLVVNRDALKQAANTAVDYYNSGSADTRKMYTAETINELDKVILSCSRMNSIDSEINIILIEEMPAYFTGQKDLDSVIAIAQDRVQKVLDERG